MSRIRTAVAVSLALLALALPLGLETVAAQAKVQKVCKETDLRSSAGPVRDHLERGDRVIVVKRDRRHHRTYVAARDGQGWISSSALCH